MLGREAQVSQALGMWGMELLMLACNSRSLECVLAVWTLIVLVCSDCCELTCSK